MYPQGQTDQRSSLPVSTAEALTESLLDCLPTEGTGLLTGAFAQYGSIRADQKAASLQTPKMGAQKNSGERNP